MISNDKFKQIIKAFFGSAAGEIVPEVEGKGATIEDKTIAAADAIYKAIVDTKWQEFDWDKNVQDFADGIGISFDEMIEALMSLFDELDIYFEVSKHTKEEKDWFTQTSKFGQALVSYGGFSDQIGKGLPTAASKLQVSSKSQTSAPTASSNLGTNKDKNNHLSRANCPGVTTPKTTSLAGRIATIVGTRADGQRFRPNINPRGNAPYKVKLTNGNGSEDCVLYFEDYQKSIEFFTKLIKADYANKNVLGITTAPATGSGLLVTTPGQGDFYTPNKMGCKYVSSDPNGYIEVETELGPAYILARKLNEEIEDEISLEENYMFECDNPKVAAFEDYNKYVEACSAQFDEFMR